MKLNRIYKILVILLVMLFSKELAAQKAVMIMEMIVTDDGKKMSGAVIEVFKNGKFLEKVLTNGKGEADIPMSSGGVFTISISGNGMITKKIEVNTNNTPTDLSEPLYYPAEVNIFNKVDGIDYGILNQPIGKIAFDADYGDFSADESHTKKVQSSLKKLTADYETKKANELLAAKENQKLYDAAVKIADKAFAAEQWEAAEIEYKKAEGYMPLEMHPQFQLAELKTKLIEIKKLNAKYDQAIAAAESAEKEKDYSSAIAEFKRAAGYKPSETYPSDKAKELQNTMANAAKAEQNYLTAIEKGDNALKINELTTAKAAFEEASGFKPDESYPKNKLAEINDILGKQEQKEASYLAAITAADAALASKDYVVAKSEYKKASSIKATEQYPKDQIAKVDGLLADEAKRDQDYLAAIELGDNSLASNKFDEAKAAFANASKIKPSEDYPKNKIKEIDAFIAKNAEKEKQYQDNISNADKLLANKSFDEAKAKYIEASSIKPTESYPKNKISEIEGILTANAENEKKYNDAIIAGDQAVSSEDYTAAKIAYNSALTLKPNESYPKDKIAEIEGIVVGMQQQEEQYNTAISAGDAALASNSLDVAKKSYLEASNIKPTETYPQDKLAEIDRIIAESAEKDKTFNNAISEGDAAFKLNDFEKATAAYTKALSVKPEETYPQTQLGLIDDKKAALEAENAALAKLEADYSASIKNGDDALANKDYSIAKTAYENASSLKSDEQYPKDKITEINSLIAANAEKDKDYQNAIEEGDKLFASEDFDGAKSAFENASKIKDSEQYPKDQLAAIKIKIEELADAEAASAKLEADYQAAITEGDSKLGSKDFDGAIVLYKKAQELKPEETYPSDKLAEIKSIQDDLAKEQAEKEAAEALQKQYDDLIAKADKAFSSGDLNLARTDYQAALALKTDESYPQSRIDEINTSLADAAEQDKTYQEAIVTADQMFASEDYENAKSKYNEAASIKSGEQYPKDKIAEIELKLSEIAANQEEIRLNNEKQAELDANYESALKEADNAFNSNDYDKAEEAYTKALSIKPEETFPKSQLAVIEQKRLELASAAEQEAAAAAQAKIDEEYATLITEADQMFAAADFDNAIAKYSKAIETKDEQYPKDQLKAIDFKINEKAEQADQAKIDAQYLALITEADALLENNELDNAVAKYNEALTVKSDPYPTAQITTIEERKKELANQAEKEAADAAVAEIESNYQAAITEADNAFNATNFDKAEQEYTKALSFKPSETYPQSQLGLIDGKREEAANLAAKALEDEARLKADAELDANYQAAIAEADAAFNSNDFATAEKAYVKALSFKPIETYPQSQLGIIDAQKEAIALKQKQEADSKAEEARLAKLELEYLAAIEEGDNLLTIKDLQGARSSFQTALTFKPEELYPSNKITEIDALIQAEIDKEAANASELNQKYQDAISIADQAFSSRAWEPALANYEEAQTYKMGEKYPAEKIKEIKQILADKLAKAEEKKLAREREAANNASYQTAIVEADNAFNSEEYENAKNKYELASNLKPSEEYPRNRITEIQNIINSKLAAIAEADRKKNEARDREANYVKYISDGDDAYSKGGLTNAKSNYRSALSLKPDEAYPKQQLAKIEAELEKTRLARLEELKKLDEPIKIQTGPRSSITDDAEAEIDRIYKEMWAKRNSDKNDIVEKSRNGMLDLQKANADKELERRNNAIEELEKISVSMKLSTQGSDDIYMQNYETIVEKEKSLTNSVEELNRDSERTREDKYTEQDDLAANIRDFQQESNNIIIEGKKDKIESRRDELKEFVEEYVDEQDERIGKAKEENENQSKRFKEYFEEKAKNNLEESRELPATLKEDWRNTKKAYSEFGDNKTDEEKDKVYKKRTDIRDYENHMSENQGNLEYQNNINNQQIEVRQFNQERNDNYKENQEIIEEKIVVLKEEEDRLNMKSEALRNGNAEKEYYQGEDKPRQDRMAENYPQGVTEEIIENQNNSTTIKRIVVEGTEVDIFEKTLYSWGGVFYAKNGDSTTKEDWDANSK